jgi:hypothetical protein
MDKSLVYLNIETFSIKSNSEIKKFDLFFIEKEHNYALRRASP